MSRGSGLFANRQARFASTLDNHETLPPHQLFHLTLPTGSGNATLDDVLSLRVTGVPMQVQAMEGDLPQPGDNPLPPLAYYPRLTFFIYDHLGNSRILYHNELIDCNPDSTQYVLEHVIDYYPFGKTLREYIYARERFQSTYHERDEESGLDYRGARFYDGEVGRFLCKAISGLVNRYLPGKQLHCFIL